MSDINYICLSDMHFGEEDSILTNLKTASTDTDPMKPSEVLKRLVKCLKSLIDENKNKKKKPTLVLNGDILELALCTTNKAAMAFERFIELSMSPGEELFDKRIIYIPGNHDHHLWEIARETQYVNYTFEGRSKKKLDVPWHVTNMFTDPVQSYFLTKLLKRHLHDMVVEIAYPNFGILDKDKYKCVIFHHGHFIDPLYQLISTFRNMIFTDREKPSIIWDIEAENFAWIDFFWSMLGRSGRAGPDIELIYEKMQDEDEFRELLYNLVDSIDKRYDLPGLDVVTARILKMIANTIAKNVVQMERKHTTNPLSSKAQKGLRAYINGPLKKQILNEQKHDMPSDVTFIFGHTHKPFQEDMNFKGYPQWVNVYNTGGWVVESMDPQPLHGGAVALVDNDLNCVSLRLYNENANPLDYLVSVEESSHTGEKDNPLHKRISALVDPASQPWKDFSTVVAEDVDIRRQNLRSRIYDKD
jgi:UDP-2,3-diacylglucosamine pyrophosphatase LpxH